MDDNQRGPFQFALRDVLWAVLVVALTIGWLLDGVRTSSALTSAVRKTLEYDNLRYERDRLSEEVQYLRWKHNDHEPHGGK